MAKFSTGISIDAQIADQAREVGSKNLWSFSEVVEIGLRLFLKNYSLRELPGLESISPQLPGLTPSPVAEVEPAEVTAKC